MVNGYRVKTYINTIEFLKTIMNTYPALCEKKTPEGKNIEEQKKNVKSYRL